MARPTYLLEEPLFIMHKRLVQLFLSALSLAVITACGSVPTPTADDAATDINSEVAYVATVDIASTDTQADIEALYEGKAITFKPEAGFAVLGFTRQQGELTTLDTTTNEDAFSAPVVAAGRGAWSGGRGAWSGGRGAWSGGRGAWSGGRGAWSGGRGAWSGGRGAWSGGRGAWSGGTDAAGDINPTWAQINLEKGHAVSRKFGEGITVAVLDTGIDLTHPLFADSLVPSNQWKDFIDNDTYPQEGSSSGHSYGHGTAAASIVLQVAPKAKILPVRVLDKDGKGDTDDIIAAIDHAVAMGADVINMSLGTPHWVDGLYRMAGYANSKGVYIVASAGNEGNSTPLAPASYTWLPNTLGRTIGIGSVDANDYLSSFSNYGSALAATAPGENVLAALPGNEMGTVTGTSFAAPQAAGAFALAMSELPNPSDIHLLGTELWESLDFDVFNKNLLKSRNTARLDIDKLVRSLPNWQEPSYNLVNAHSDKCLDIQSRGYDGDRVTQHTCGDHEPDQQFRLESVGDAYKIVSALSGKVLDVSHVSRDNGAKIHQWSYVGSANQLWELRPVDQGYQLVSKHSGKCMVVADQSQDSGVEIHQWTCNDNTNQQFRIEMSR